jgi:endonuclease/exonuclease/phosphatase family metal-dependent hydrolase
VELTVATWNIWGQSSGYEGRRSGIPPVLEATGADLVGLVEVWRDGERLQIEELAAELGYAHSAYADVYAGTGELPWGVGILSRFPIEAQQRLEFPNPVVPIVGDEYHGAALVSSVRLPVGVVDVVCLCEWGLTWSGYGVEGAADRLPAYVFLAHKLRAANRAIAPIVMGDFNAIPESSELRALTGKDPGAGLEMTFMDAWEFANGSQGGWTFDGLANPHLRKRPFGRHRIDYVLTGAGERIPRLWRVNEATVFGEEGPNGPPPSDHYGVRVELELAELHPGASIGPLQ